MEQNRHGGKMATGEKERRVPGEAAVVRICHDLAGPAGALANGIELLAMDGAEGGEETLALLRDSARALTARLDFFRAVFGQPTARALKSGAAARAAAEAYLAQQGDRARRFALSDFPEGEDLPLLERRLALALALAGADALPFGGTVAVTRQNGGVCLRVAGRRAGWMPEVAEGFLRVSADPRAAATALVRELSGTLGWACVPWQEEGACGVDPVPAPLENLQS
jgi:histidine phosphotransferase ChpT